MKKYILILVLSVVYSTSIFSQEIRNSAPPFQGSLVKGFDNYYLHWGLYNTNTCLYFKETIILIYTTDGTKFKFSGKLENELTPNYGNDAWVSTPITVEQIEKLKDGISQVKINSCNELIVKEFKNDDKNPGKKIYKKYLELKEFE